MNNDPVLTLPAGTRKVVYVDRAAMSAGEPAYVVRSQGQVYHASRVTGFLQAVQSEDRLMDDGPHCWLETDAALAVTVGTPVWATSCHETLLAVTGGTR